MMSTWVDAFRISQENRRLGIGIDKSSMPFGPEIDQRTDLNRPTYWMTDISDYPDAIFDIPYVENSTDKAQRLSILYPENTEKKDLPLLIYVHGGGFAGGNSSEDGKKLLYTCEAALYALADGYAVAAVDYRCKPQVELIDIVHDVKAAIRYLRSNAEVYGLDGKRFALIGESAGGFLVDICGTTGDIDMFDDASMGCGGISSAVQAVVSWYSIFDVDGYYLKEEELYPGRYIDRNTPPFLIQHGLKDTEVDYHNSIHLYDLLIENGITQSHIDLVDGADHAVRWFITEANAKRILRWLDNVLDKKDIK